MKQISLFKGVVASQVFGRLIGEAYVRAFDYAKRRIQLQKRNEGL